jgi:hypothetical protein
VRTDPSMPTRPRVQSRALVGGAIALLAVSLSACSIRMPGRESLETAIPAALVASDLGITAAEADKRTDGFAVNVSVYAEMDSDSVTADELRDMLRLVVENTDLSDVNTLDIMATVGPYSSDVVHVDLGAPAAELGFDDEGDSDFEAPWEDVVALLDE